MVDEAWLDDRRARFWKFFDFGKGPGLEIGPLHAAIVQREAADVKYVDIFTREQLLQNYRDDPNVDVDQIPEIDFCLMSGGKVLPVSEAASPGGPYAWVMASHVIEHVPDLIGWLGEVADLVVDGGALVLAIPDRRYCFDVFRPSTTVGAMLQAHDDGDRVPSVRAVYDYHRSKVEVDTPKLWAGERPPSYDERTYALTEVTASVDRAREGEYVDSHVWTFTPDTFLEQIRDLRSLGVAGWVVEKIEAPQGEIEFYVVMRRLERGADVTAEQPGEPAPSADMPDWLDVQDQRTSRIAELDQVSGSLRTRLAEALSDLNDRNADVIDLERDLITRRGEAEKAELRIAGLQKRADRAKARHEALQKKVETLTDQNSRLRAKISTRDARIKRLQERLARQRERVSELESSWPVRAREAARRSRRRPDRQSPDA